MRLGLLGISEGNGHPYSWGAIINGYDREKMEKCGFPVIPRYLETRNWPADRICNAQITSVWTQDIGTSQKIAEAVFIGDIAESPESMVGKVDAILLARDDANNHAQLARPFLLAGMPIYIDKPIALSVDDLDKIYSMQQYPGQIFTCSALRYASELKLNRTSLDSLGSIREIHAVTPKSWDKYSLHIIEPVFNFLESDDTPVEFFKGGLEAFADSGSSNISIRWKSGIVTRFFALGNSASPISFRIYGTTGFKDLIFTDPFSAFKSALQDFILGVHTGVVVTPKEHAYRVVQIIESGRSL